MCSQQNYNVVERFREYLKIPSAQPNVDYGDCIKFLKKEADLLNLPIQVYELVPKKPVAVITWRGTEPELSSILLNSHMDVVPANEEHWTHPPFEAHVTDDGFIYARGTQDMKSVGIIHLEAVRRLKDAGVKLKRTVHISFMADEEVGSVDGMQVFSDSNEFKELNIGFAFDESTPCPLPDVLVAFYGERTARKIKVTCTSQPGHGSLLPKEKTAGEKIHYIIDKFMKLRAQEKNKLDSGWALGDVTTINLTILEGGVLINVLPETLSASFDIRIAPNEDHDEFEETIKKWCKEAGEGVTFEYIVKNPKIESTAIDGSVPFWNVFVKTVRDMGIEVRSAICGGATDARFVRRHGIPAVGFTPIMNTPQFLHAHNERVHVDEFMKGIDIMKRVLQAVANV